MSSPKTVLVVLTSTSEFPEHVSLDATKLGISQADSRRTGFDVKEVAYLYEMLEVQGDYDLEFASPRGGHCTIDPISMKYSESDEIVRKFLKCSEAIEEIRNTKRLSDIDPADYHCVVFPGGPGTLFDLPNNPKINDIVQHVYQKPGCIATIGHGISALLNVKTPKGSDLWLKGKRVTCGTVEEEKEMQLDKALPFMLEQKLKEIGARFEKAEKFASKVVVDERLITGQNRDSSQEWVQKIASQCHVRN